MKCGFHPMFSHSSRGEKHLVPYSTAAFDLQSGRFHHILPKRRMLLHSTAMNLHRVGSEFACGTM